MQHPVQIGKDNAPRAWPAGTACRNRSPAAPGPPASRSTPAATLAAISRSHRRFAGRLADHDQPAGPAHRLEYRVRGRAGTAYVDRSPPARCRPPRRPSPHPAPPSPMDRRRPRSPRFPDASPARLNSGAGGRTCLPLAFSVVAALRFEEQHRIVAVDGLLDHPVRVDRVRAGDQLKAAGVCEVRLRRLGVVLDRADAAAERNPAPRPAPGSCPGCGSAASPAG